MPIDCRPLQAFEPNDLASVRAAFANATPIMMRQAWLEVTERDFAPGTVRTGWRDETLLVFAELSDADIFTRATRHNDRFWQLGDTFEIFLQPERQAAYLELHVTPNNLRLQLRFERPPTAQDRDPFSAALIQRNIFESRTWVDARTRRWHVLAEIPAAAASADRLAGSTWRFSFGRYDATRTRDQPVISSSSAHTQAAFHRPDEWGSLHFAS